MQRRAFLAGSGALTLGWPQALGATTPASAQFRMHDLLLDGDKSLARRSLLLVPKHARPAEKLRVLVLLHGLGETGNELLGIHAWGDRYGLVKSYERLRTPPVERTLPRLRYFTDEHLTQVNKSLTQKSFRGMALLCPVTPNPYKLQPAAKTLDRYAEWIEKTLLPAARDKADIGTGPEFTGLDGCSLGGYVGIETFLRKPELFGTFGGVQAAFGAPTAILYAKKLAEAIRQVGPRSIRAGTSSADPYKKANEVLSNELHKLDVPNTLSVLPGPHNQPWLREVGTLDMLLWHDRQLGVPRPPHKAHARPVGPPTPK
jgi:pimeloyl-ACP methyl ester carboxylesterase